MLQLPSQDGQKESGDVQSLPQLICPHDTVYVPISHALVHSMLHWTSIARGKS